MRPLFDTHAHFAMIENRTVDEAFDRAVAEGVEYFTTVSTELPNWESNRQIAHRLKNVFYTVGVHPHEAKDWDSWAKELEQFLTTHSQDKKLVGVGETGLDFYYNHSDRDSQIRGFEYQVGLAKKYERTLIIHCRDSFDELYAIVKKVGLGKGGGIMHCFTGDTVRAKEALDLGLHISFSGIVTFKNADSLRQAAKTVPLDRLLMETDCPFLTPVPHRGVPNEPYYLPFTARVLAGTLGVDPQMLAEKTTENAKVVFGTI